MNRSLWLSTSSWPAGGASVSGSKCEDSCWCRPGGMKRCSSSCKQSLCRRGCWTETKWTGHSKDGVLYAQACPSTEDEELAVCPVSCVLC